MCKCEQVLSPRDRRPKSLLGATRSPLSVLLVAVLVAVGCATSTPVSFDTPALSQQESTPLPNAAPASPAEPAAPPAAPAEPTEPPVASVAPPSEPEITIAAPVWESCPAGQGECTTVTVPLDYDDPGGDSIEIAVARAPALDSDNRIGPLFLNFGGPGGETTEIFSQAASVFSTVFPRFDIVAWDPRGIGATERLACDVLGEEFVLIELDPSDGFDDEIAVQEAEFAEVAACASASGPIIDHLGTVNVARDLNAVRIALGDEQLNYLGFSYGTQIGWVYATLFGDSVRSMVLDGAVPGGSIDSEDFVTQLAAFQRTFDHFDAACDQALSCVLADEGLAEAVERIAGLLRDEPVSMPDGTLFGEAEFRAAVLSSLYSPAVDIGPTLAQGIIDAGRGDISTLDRIRNSGGDTSTPGGYQAVICADGGQFPGPEGQAADYASTFAVSETFGLLGEAVRCDLWPGEIERPPAIDTTAAPTILVVGSTLDPATPFEDAVLLDEQLADSVLLTVEASGHTAVVGNECATDYAIEYFNDLTAPEQGAVCAVRGLIGVQITDSADGLLIESVLAGSAAEQAGISVGDIVVSVDGTETPTTSDFPFVPPDVPLDWVVARDGEQIRLTISARRPAWS